MKVFKIEKCRNCYELLENSNLLTIYNFIRHCERGKAKPISFDEHEEEYDFSDSDSIIENFLRNVRSRFVPSDNKVTRIKCSFSFVNKQLLVYSCDVHLSSLRYWSTNVYKTKYFNDFVHFSLKQNISSRLIINTGMEVLGNFWVSTRSIWNYWWKRTANTLKMEFINYYAGVSDDSNDGNSNPEHEEMSFLCDEEFID